MNSIQEHFLLLSLGSYRVTPVLQGRIITSKKHVANSTVLVNRAIIIFYIPLCVFGI